MSNRSGDPLVIGLGSLHGGDDRVGLDVAAAVARLQLERADVVEHADPTDLVTLWEARDHVVVIDALLAGDDPGTVRVIEAGTDESPLTPARAWTASGGTHGFGLADAVALARALGRLPRRLAVVGVVGRTFQPSAAMSPEVQGAIPDAVEAVLVSLEQQEPADVPR